jgi:hypothetical protein
LFLCKTELQAVFHGGNMTRSIIVVTGFVVLGIASLFQGPPAPKPIKTVPVTEAQIRDGVKNEQKAKAVKRAIATARQVYRRNHVSEAYSEATGRVAVEAGLSPRLLAAVVVVESHGNPKAISNRNSIGLMQVNPLVWGHKKDLTNPEKNITIGASILVSYVRRFGLVEGLHHYNGYSDVHEHVYVNKVLEAGQIVVM